MAIRRIRLPNGQEIVLDDWVHWPMYSTIEFARNATVDLYPFSYVVGQRVPQSRPAPTGVGVANRNATKSDTNQVAKARMNHDEAFVAFSLTYEHFALLNAQTYTQVPNDLPATRPILTGTDLRKLQADLMVDLLVGADLSKQQVSAPLSYFGQGIGSPAYTSGDAVNVAVGASTAMNFAYGTGGSINPNNQRRWPIPVPIHSNRVFKMHVHSPGGAPGTGWGRVLDQDVQLKFYLDGIKRRPVV